MRVYLGGPINGCTDEEANGWRIQAKALIWQLGHQWLDPMDRDYRGREMEPGIAAEIVESDKADIDQCDLILVNCPKPSVGSSMEIFYANRPRDPLGERLHRVVAVVPRDKAPSPWLVYHTDALYHSVVEALERELA